MRIRNCVLGVGAIAAVAIVGCQAEDGLEVRSVDQNVMFGPKLQPGEFPWTVKIDITHLDGTTEGCTGALIAPNYVLTAGHCAMEKAGDIPPDFEELEIQPGQYEITLGDLDIVNPPAAGEPEAQHPAVTDVIVHPFFTKAEDPEAGPPDSPAENDVAILVLDGSVELNELVHPVRLSNIIPSEGDEVYLSGWGQDGFTVPSLVPRWMSGTVANVDNCNAYLTGDAPVPQPKYTEREMNENEFCITGDLTDDGKQSGCFGDSGGAVVIQPTEGCYEQVGIHVWGDQLCIWYTVETQVADYLSWIRSEVVGLEGDVVYEAESINHQTGGTHPNAWNIWDNGYIWFDHTFQGGTEEMYIRAAGQDGNGWPRMQVRVNGSVVYDNVVDSAEYEVHNFSFPAPVGNGRVEIWFPNDYYAPPIDRNLFVDKIALARQGCPEPEEEAEIGDCTEATATDLGADGAIKTVAGNACLMVRDAYPSWWGTDKGMRIHALAADTYPVDYAWTNPCSSGVGSGSGSLTVPWDQPVLPNINSSCATLIKLNGDESETVDFTYYGG